jgi:hypothetical protein
MIGNRVSLPPLTFLFPGLVKLRKEDVAFSISGLIRRVSDGMFSAPKARVGAETSTREVAREKLRWEESGKGSIALKHAQQLSPGDQDRNSTDDCVSQV